LPELPAPPDTTNANQEIVHSFDLVYPPSDSIERQINYYSTGTSNPGQYGSSHQYPQGQGYDPSYHQHPQGTTSIPYHPGQNARDTYPQPGVNSQWTQGHYPNTDFVRSTSWSPQHIGQSAPPQHTGHLAPPLISHGSTSMNQIQHPSNIRGQSQVVVPQRPYVPHHRQNYFDQFIPENPITFPRRHGGDGIPFTDVLSENFDCLVGRDDPMFANYTGPAISLRLEWPGYKSWTKQIKTKDWRRDPQPITKSKLAVEVAKKVQTFVQDNINEPMTPGTERWRVGPSFIQVDDLVLVRLVHVSKGSWQAEFRVFG